MPVLDTRATSLLTAITEGGDFRLCNKEVLVIAVPGLQKTRVGGGQTVRFRGGWVAFCFNPPFDDPCCVQLSKCLGLQLENAEDAEADNV